MPQLKLLREHIPFLGCCYWHTNFCFSYIRNLSFFITFLPLYEMTKISIISQNLKTYFLFQSQAHLLLYLILPPISLSTSFTQQFWVTHLPLFSVLGQLIFINLLHLSFFMYLIFFHSIHKVFQCNEGRNQLSNIAFFHSIFLRFFVIFRIFASFFFSCLERVAGLDMYGLSGLNRMHMFGCTYRTYIVCSEVQYRIYVVCLEVQNRTITISIRKIYAMRY